MRAQMTAWKRICECLLAHTIVPSPPSTTSGSAARRTTMQLNPSTCYMKGEAYSIAQAWQWRFPMMWCTTAAASPSRKRSPGCNMARLSDQWPSSTPPLSRIESTHRAASFDGSFLRVHALCGSERSMKVRPTRPSPTNTP